MIKTLLLSFIPLIVCIIYLPGQVVINEYSCSNLPAIFISSVLSDSLIINEINYHSADNFDPGDWVELYNPQQYALNISNWKIKDEVDSHEFIFPAGTVIPSGGFLVVAEDMNSFDSLFPNVSNYVGPMGFDLSGNGELISPSPDNALASSWEASCEPHGTPGEQNCTNVIIPQYQSDRTASFLIYPNPFTTSASIVIKSAKPIENGTLVIYNLTGKEVRRIDHIRSNRVTVDRENLLPGIYLFKLYYAEGENFITGKLVVL